MFGLPDEYLAELALRHYAKQGYPDVPTRPARSRAMNICILEEAFGDLLHGCIARQSTPEEVLANAIFHWRMKEYPGVKNRREVTDAERAVRDDPDAIWLGTHAVDAAYDRAHLLGIDFADFAAGLADLAAVTTNSGDYDDHTDHDDPGGDGKEEP